MSGTDGDLFDAYAELHVSRDADPAVVRAVHRELAKRYHPDRGGSAADAAAMTRINRARDVLLDPAARAALDAELDRRESARAAERSGGGQAASSYPDETVDVPFEDEWGQETDWSARREPQWDTRWETQRETRWESPWDGPDPAPLYAPDPEPYHGSTDQRYRTGYVPDHELYEDWTPARPVPLDGVSITAFVLALACSGPLGLILGIVGLFRTGKGVRTGRWAAVSAVLIGIVTSAIQLVWLLRILTEVLE